MKKHFYYFIFLTLLTGLFLQSVNGQNVNVNPGGGTFATLKAAFDAINAGTYTGAITIDIVGNTTETATAVLNASGPPSNYSSIVISPSGSGTKTISGNIFGNLIDLNGADNITINGLNSLTISNTGTTSASTIRFYGDATNNLLTNCTILGAATTGGVVNFSGGGVTTGNDNNTVSYCNIGPAGVNFPVAGIYSLGTSATIDNSNNTISNNNIYDYFNASSVTAGMNINSFNSAWTISNNRLYQTANRTYTSSGTHNGIFITSGAGYTISGNIIGYANSSGTGTTNMIGLTSGALGGNFPGAYTAGGTANATRYVAINCTFTVGGTASSIQNNTVAGFALYTSSGASSTYGIFCGIGVFSGNVNIGTINGNTIGTPTSSIYTATTTSGGMIAGIYTTGSNTVTIANNTIQNLDAMGTTASNSGGINGINTEGTGGTVNVFGNIIGNGLNPNLRMGNLTTGAFLSNVGTTFGAASGSAVFQGIRNAQTGTVTIGTMAKPNTIRNAYVNSTATTAYTRGIYSAAGTVTIVYNTIANLASASSNVTFTNAGLSTIGILLYTCTAPVVSNNTISGLSITNTGTGGYNVAGISYTAPTTSITITKNKIYGLSNASTSTSVTAPGTASGIFIRDGFGYPTDISNNMISLGGGQATNTAFIGIWVQYLSASPTTLKIYYNSINIEGTVTSGDQPSMCLQRGDFSATPATVYTIDAKNNIFNNTRSGGGGKHYALANNYGAAVSSATGWPANASNYNLLNSNASTIGYWSGDKTFADWKTASSCDGNSYSNYPQTFLDAAMADLHINMGVTPTVIESGGIIVAGVADDYDNEPRPGPPGTAPDIGADEFAGVPLDILPPIITYTPLPNTNETTTRTMWAKVTDPSGVPITAPGWPTLYWKKATEPGYTAVAPFIVAGDKYFYEFGGGVSLGDVVCYYIVARDEAAPIPNLGSNPSGATGFTYDPPAAASPPPNPNCYSIVEPLNGAYYVGVTMGNPYATISAAIADLNFRGVSGPVTFLLEDATYPSETYPINIFVNNINLPTALHPVTIKPKTGVMSTISGASPNSQIFSIRNSYITIDGSNEPGGTTRDLTITNTSATAPQVIGFSSTGTTPLVGCGVKNCNIINGAQTSSAVVLTGTDGAAGYYNNITIQNNSVKTAYIGIYCSAAQLAGNGTGLNISGNDLNWTGTSAIRLVGIYVQGFDGATVSNNYVGNIANTADASNVTGIWFATGTTNSTLSGNNIYSISGTASAPRGIALSPAVANANINVTGNTISGITSTYSSATYGINLFSAVSGVTIEKNRISNIKNTNTSGYSAIGIALNSTLASANITVRNNLIWDVAGYGWNSTSTDNGYGINIQGGGGYNLYYNSINLATNQTSATGLPACLIISSTVTAASSIDIRNNIFSIPATVGTNRYAVICNATSAVFSNIDNNDYYTSGPNLGYMGGANVLNLAAWTMATGKDSHSISVDPQYTSATNLLPLSTSPVVGAGVSLPGIVDDDLLGNTRGTVTTLGAYEIFMIGLKIYQLSYNWPELSVTNSIVGMISGNFFPLEIGGLYINAYTKDQTGALYWIGQNYYLPDKTYSNISQQNVSFTFSLAPLGVVEGTSIASMPVWITVGTLPTTVVPVPQDYYFTTVPVVGMTNNTGGGYPITNPWTGNSSETWPVYINPIQFSNPLITVVYRGCDVPNIDLDSANHPAGSKSGTGYAGDKNACGPAGACNSLEWLEKGHPECNNGQTPREAIEDLSGEMGRTSGSGVGPDDFIGGKLKYVQKHKLPIHTKFQSWEYPTDSIKPPGSTYAATNQTGAGGKPDWNWLVQEMQAGEDVEIFVGYFNSSGTFVGGHVVTCTGVIETASGLKGITYKDDKDQSKTDPNAVTQTSSWIYTGSDGFLTVPSESSSTVTGKITNIVSESYDASIVWPTTKTLNLKGLLEGLCDIPFLGLMRQAMDEMGAHFGSGIADQVTVELHNAADYSIIEFSSGLLNMSTGGDVSIGTIPGSLSGSYWITLLHRNSILTVSANPVSFAGSTISYDFTTAASQAYGDNQKDLGGGYFAFWGGDVNQDGIVDSGDLNPVDNLATAVTFGYFPEDVNGDGIVDSGDLNIVDNNSTALIMALTP